MEEHPEKELSTVFPMVGILVFLVIINIINLRSNT